MTFKEQLDRFVDAGVTKVAHIVLLLALADRGEMCAKECAKVVGFTDAGITYALDKLCECGLTSRARRTENRRIIRVALTAAGEELVRERRTEHEHAEGNQSA